MLDEFIPETAKGVLIAAFLSIVLVIAVFTTGLAPVAIGALLAGVVLYALYVVGVRLHRWLLGTRGGAA
jgi:hypothetical protein